MRHLFFLSLLSLFFLFSGEAQAKKLFVVTTLSTYSAIVKEIGGKHVRVVHLVQGFQDPHFMTPKPSKALLLSKADIFVSTGLDLELWAPSLIDKSGNGRIRSGQVGYVSASHGMRLLEKPKVFSRSEGGLHIYGNPHFYNSPLCGLTIAKNIAMGLQKNAPQHTAYFQRNLSRFQKKLQRKLFGARLLKLLGARVLVRLARAGRLMAFLHKRSYRGKKLIDYAGGWLQKGRHLYKHKLVSYHKNWSYFAHLFGLHILAYIEPKPGIPPSPRHVQQVLQKMKYNRIKVLLAANYYPEGKVRKIASRAGAKALIVSLMPGGKDNPKGYFAFFDHLIGRIAAAFSPSKK